MRAKARPIQSQIIAALHLIDREIGTGEVPEDQALLLFIRDVCKGLERCRLTWLHLVADEMRKERGNGTKLVKKAKMTKKEAIAVVAKHHPKWPTPLIEGYARAMLDAPCAVWLN